MPDVWNPPLAGPRPGGVRPNARRATRLRGMTTLADLTTLRVGGPIAEYVRVSTTDALVDAVAAADAAGGPLLVVG